VLTRNLFEWRIENAECKLKTAVLTVCLNSAGFALGMKHRELLLRTKAFALQVIEFCERLPNDETSKILKRQLLRAGTSVGANYRAACRAKSKPTFISKMGDVLEETDECGYWTELLVDAGKVDQASATPVLEEASELVAISISSINTAKQNS